LAPEGVKLPYTSFHDHRFTFLSETGVLAIRLPKDEREAFLKTYVTTLMEARGAEERQVRTSANQTGSRAYRTASCFKGRSVYNTWIQI
jgi:hypothetical protein